MRKIKFRTWDTINKEFSEWTNRDPFFDTSHGKIFFWERTKKSDGSYGGDIILEDIKDRFILQQYTGLKDRNGTEIYEGDIITLTSNDGLDYNGEVVYYPFFAHYGVSMERTHLTYDWIQPLHEVWSAAYTEIVGNIFQNPELLKA